MSSTEVKWVNEPYYDCHKQKRLDALFAKSVLDDELRKRFEDQYVNPY